MRNILAGHGGVGGWRQYLRACGWMGAFLGARLFAQIGALDHPFLDPVFKPDITGIVNAATDQPDGKILIAGSITLVNGLATTGFVRLNRDGSLDTTFHPPAIDQGGASIVAMTTSPDGRILIGGSFTRVGEMARTNLARLLPDGSLDTTFVPAALPAGFSQPPTTLGEPIKSAFSGLRIFASGDVLIGWTSTRTFPEGTGTPSKRLLNESARYNADGSRDFSYVALPVSPLFPRDSLDRPYRIDVLGQFQPSLTLYRLSPSGERDLQIDKTQSVYDVRTGTYVSFDYFAGFALLCNDQMLSFRNSEPLVPNPKWRQLLRRLSLDGVPDAAFPETEFDQLPEVITALRDGRVLLGGTFTRISYSPIAGTTVTNPVGKVVIFMPNPAPRSLVVGAGSQAILTASPTNGPYQWQFQGTNLPGQTNRSLVLDAASPANAGVYAVVNPQPAGTCLNLSLPQFVLSVTNSMPNPGFLHAGSVDPDFDPQAGADGAVKAMALAASGRIMAGGAFAHFGGGTHRGLARLMSDGRVDTAFSAGLGVEGTNSPAVGQIAFKPDGRLVVAGSFGRFGGVARPGLAVLQADGTVDPGFDPAARYELVPPGTTRPLLMDEYSGALLVTQAGVIHVVKPDEMGGLSLVRYDEIKRRVNWMTPASDAYFGGPFPGARSWHYLPGSVDALATAPDGRVLAAGRFVAQDYGSFINDIACLDATTNFFPSACYSTSGLYDLAPSGLPFHPQAVAVLADGKLLVAGAGGLVRVTPDAKVDPAFSLGLARTNFTHVAVAPDGRIVVAGEFQTIDGQKRNRIARLNADGTLDTAFDSGSGPNGAIHALVIQPDGNILIGGDFTEVNGLPRKGVARLLGATPGLVLANARHTATGLAFTLTTSTNTQYVIEYKNALSAAGWTMLTNVTGDGTSQTVVDASIGVSQRFYRARTKP